MRKSPVPPVVHLLGLTIFALTTAEFMVAGMMPALAQALDVSLGEVGNLISWYALGMALGGPVVTVAALAMGWSPKRALMGLLGAYVVASAFAAGAQSYAAMATARILMGVASAACIGLALTICATLVAPGVRGRAASVVLGGLMLSPVFGVPATTLIAQGAGWRVSFWAVTALALACTLLVAWRVPASSQEGVTRLADHVSAVWRRGLWAAYITSGLIIGAAFTAFSYFAPIFVQVTGLPSAAVPALLVLYGLANVAGNIVVGRYADAHTMRVLGIGLAVLAVALAAFALLADNVVGSLLAFMAIGLTGVALNPAMVARVMRASEPGPLVNTLHASVITFGLAAGTWAGGAAIDAGMGLRAPLWIGAAMATAGLLSLLPYVRRRARPACEDVVAAC